MATQAARWRRAIALLGTAALLSGCGASAVETPLEATAVGGAACAAVQIRAPELRGAVHPGDRLELTVEHLTAVCADTPNTGSQTNGPIVDEVVHSFEVLWLQDDARTVLDVIEPNDGSPFTVGVIVPQRATTGSASIRIGTSALPLDVESP